MQRKAVFLTLVALASSTDALALGSLADVEVIDRVSGETLGVHYFRGEYWVAGRPGAKYAVRVRNQSGGRVLAVMSVDGVNVLSGATAGYDQEGYIFSAGTAYEITGWRKSQWEVAAFTFTDATDSYAERTGRPANVGVIGVALFRERVPPPVALTSPTAPSPAPSPAYSGGAAARREGMLADSAAITAGRSAPQPAAKLGTGHGEREGSYVDYAAFDREAARPNEVIRIRYDSAENLLALGVIRRAAPVRAPLPVPFPDSPPSFVPDPPG
jgi:hypothetical protein